MIRSNILCALRVSLCIAAFCESGIHASEPKKQATKPAQNKIPTNKFNSFAQKIYGTEERTEETYKTLQKEFEKLMGVGATALLPRGTEKNKMCVDEVRLMLDDFKDELRADEVIQAIDAQKTRAALNKTAKKTLPMLAATQKLGLGGQILSDDALKLLNKATGGKAAEAVTESLESRLKRQEQERKEEAQRERFEPLFGEPQGAPRELVPEQELSPLELSKQAAREILAEPTVPEPEAQPATEVLEQLMTEPVTKSTQVPQTRELTINEYGPLDDIVTMLTEKVSTSAQQERVSAFAKQAEFSVAGLPTPQQGPVVRAARQIVTTMVENGAAAVADRLSELVQQSISYTTDLVPVTKKGAEAAPLIKVDFIDLPQCMFDILDKSILTDPKKVKMVIEGLGSFIRTCTKNSDLIMPTVSSALLLAAETQESDALKATQETLQLQFMHYLKTFDALRASIAQKMYKEESKALVPQLKAYTSKWFLKGWRTGTSPEILVPQMISAYEMAGSLGRVLIYAIEHFVTLGMLDPQFIKKWDRGQLAVTLFGTEKDKQPFMVYHQYKKGAKNQSYAEALEEDLARMRQDINKAIETMSTKTDQNKFIATVERIERDWDRADKAAQKQAASVQSFTPKRAALVPSVKVKQQIIGLPGTASVIGTRATFVPKKLKQEQKPIPPKPAEAQPETFEPLTVEPQPQAIEVPPTALPVLDPKEFTRLVDAINALQQEVVTGKEIREKRAQLQSFVSKIASKENNPAYQAALKKLEELDEFVKVKERATKYLQELQKYTEDIKIYIKDEEILKPTEFKQMTLWRETLTRARSIPDDIPEKKVIIGEFEKQLDNYVIMVVKRLTRTKNYHESIQKTVLQDSAMEGVELIQSMSQTIYYLNKVKPITDASIKKNIDKAVGSVCVIYDALLYVLYTPTQFKPLIGEMRPTIKKITTTQETPADEVYVQLIERITNLVTPLVSASKTFDEITGLEDMSALGFLEGLMTADNKKLLDSGQFDITTLDATLVDNGEYRYAVAAKTPIVIDEGIEVKTLRNLDSLHKKTYIDLLDEWSTWVGERTHIGEFKKYTPEMVSTMQDEKFAELAHNMQQLYDDAPTLFDIDDDLKSLYEAVMKRSKNSALSNLIAELRTQIIAAQTLYEKSHTTITLIPFKEKMEKIKVLGNSATFADDIAKIMELFTNYLQSIAMFNVDQVKDFPARGFNGDKTVQESIKTMVIPDEFIAMLTQLYDMKLLSASDKSDDPYNTLYMTILRGYGYILATFDALTAKLQDGVVNKPSWVEFFSGIDTQAQYISAQHIIKNLLRPVANARHYYYERLIEPYFERTSLIQAYRAGRLNLLMKELDLVDITRDGSYLYARSMDSIKSSFTTLTDAAKVVAGFPTTGVHMRNATGEIKYGGDAQYKEIIEAWQLLIDALFATELGKDKQKIVNTKLDFILNTPLGRQRKILVAGMFELKKEEPEYQNTFKTLYTSATGGASVYGYLEGLRGTALNKEEIRAYLDMFFISLYDRVGDPALPDLLKDLKSRNMLDDTVRNKVRVICANGFALLDSLIKWAYVTVQKTPNARKFVGTTLGAYYSYMQFIIEHLMTFMPYVPETDWKAYRNKDEGFNIRSAAPYNKDKGTGIPEALGSVEAQSSYMFALGTINVLGQAEPVTFEGTKLKLLLTGYYTQAKLTASLKNLGAIITKLGGKIEPNRILEIVRLLEPIHSLFDAVIVTGEMPSVAELNTGIERMQKNFVEVQKIKKESESDVFTLATEQQPIMNILTSSAITLIEPHLIFDKIQITPAQKDTYKKLVQLFKTNFGAEISGILNDYLADILADKPIIFPTKVEEQKPVPTKKTKDIAEAQKPFTPVEIQPRVQLKNQ